MHSNFPEGRTYLQIYVGDGMFSRVRRFFKEKIRYLSASKLVFISHYVIQTVDTADRRLYVRNKVVEPQTTTSRRS